MQNTTQLTSITVQAISGLRLIDIKDNSGNLQTVKITGSGELPQTSISIAAKSVSEITISGITKLNSISLNGAATNATTILCKDLVTIKDGLNISCNGTSNNKITFTDLKYVKAKNDIYNILYWTGKFTEFNFPLLEELPSIDLDGDGTKLSINTLSFPSLKRIYDFSFDHNMDIQTLNFPVLERCDRFYIEGSYPNFINLTLNMPLLNYCRSIYISLFIYDSTKINNLLHQFLTVQPASGKEIYLLSGQVPSSPPTGQGIIDKNTLIATGNTVITD